MTEGGDIKFRVYIKKSEGNVVDLVPLNQVDSHLAMEEGQFTCEEPGKCKLHCCSGFRMYDGHVFNYWNLRIDVVEFDNTFSYLRSKKLRYHIIVDPPL